MCKQCRSILYNFVVHPKIEKINVSCFRLGESQLQESKVRIRYKCVSLHTIIMTFRQHSE